MRISRRCCIELREVVTRYERLKKRAGALTSSICCCAPATCSSGNESVRSAFQRRFACLSSSTSFRTPIRCRPRSRFCFRQSRRLAERLASHHTGAPASCSSSATRSRRFIASGARRRDLSRGVRSAGGPRGEASLPHTSFRSTPAIQRVVNASFSAVMTGDR